MKLSVLPADPAGNRTLLVLDPVAPGRRAAVAAWMLAAGIGRGEQVGFVAAPQRGGRGRLEMMGGEFCGNATRSFGLWLAAREGGKASRVTVEVSGCTQLLEVEADPAAGWAATQMPLPREIRPFRVPGAGWLEGVVFEGITHLPVVGSAPDPDLVARVVEAVERDAPCDAVGVLFFREETMTMEPAVYVRETGTTVFESSCGSGTVALAAWLGQRKGDGVHRFAVGQPGGVIEAEIRRENGKTTGARMGGPVVLEEVLTVELPAGLTE